MTQLTIDQIEQVNPSLYTYPARLEGDESGGFLGIKYPHGEGWTGREVGQRTTTFVGDYPKDSDPVFIERDTLWPTTQSLLDKLSQEDLGLPDLPTWISGSARTYNSDGTGQVFPDTSVWHLVADLLQLGDATPLLRSAGLSLDPTFGLDTGPATPRVRQVYWLDGVITANQATTNLICEDRVVREASSYWDFSTAFDPVYLPIQDNNGILLRNLSQTVTIDLTVPTNTFPLDQYDLTQNAVSGLIDNILEDAELAVIWAGDRSLSQTIYIPSARALGPVPTGYDISTNIVYPMPYNPELILGTSSSPGSWGSSKYPFGIDSPINATTYIIAQTLPEDSYEIAIPSGGIIGRAFPIDARNGWDRAGEFIGLGRKFGESDLRYSGRQQKTWIAATQPYSSGTIDRCNRMLSAVLGQSQILETWQGQTVDLPNNFTGFDLVARAGAEKTITLYYSLGDITSATFIPYASGMISTDYEERIQGGYVTPSYSDYVEYASGSITAERFFRAKEDLTAYETCLVSVNGNSMIPGRDFLLSVEDPSLILFRESIPLVGQEIKIQLFGRRRYKIVLTEEFEAVYSAWNPARSGLLVNAESLPSGFKNFIGANQNALRESRTQFATAETSATFVATQVVADTIPGDFYSPALISQGPKVSTASRVADRRLFTPGRIFMTQLGQNVLGNPMNPPLWSDQTLAVDLIQIPGILTDVEDTVYTW